MVLPEEVRTILDPLPCPWHVAGGWAIDLFVGRRRRAHKDVDVAIARSNFAELTTHFRDKALFKVVDRKLATLRVGEPLDRSQFQVFVDTGWPAGQIEFFLEDHQDGEWVFRRNPAIRAPLAAAHMVSADGVPFLAPQIVLLFKAKHAVDGNGSDDADFEACLPLLSAESRNWLAEGIRAAHPGHDWLHRLT